MPHVLSFWKFILFIFVASLLLIVLNALIFGPEISYRYKLDASGNPVGEPIISTKFGTGILGDIFYFATLVPWLAVTWRRMHDSSLPGFLPLLPIVAILAAISFVFMSNSRGPDGATQASIPDGAMHTFQISGFDGLLLLFTFVTAFALNTYWLARRSTPDTNKYGPNPHEVLP